MKAVPKAGGNIIYKMLEIVYSPITAREEQVTLRSLSKSFSFCMFSLSLLYFVLDGGAAETRLAKEARPQK